MKNRSSNKSGKNIYEFGNVYEIVRIGLPETRLVNSTTVTAYGTDNDLFAYDAPALFARTR